jgi:hypothetical protein
MAIIKINISFFFWGGVHYFCHKYDTKHDVDVDWGRGHGATSLLHLGL